MKRFKNILYFADGIVDDSPALERALGLARSNHARLTLFDVTSADAPGNSMPPEPAIDMEGLLREQRQEQLEALAGRHHGADSLLYVQVATGEGFVEVIRAVDRSGYDLVIKPARSLEGLNERIFGSTDLHLMRKCPCPLWVDRPGDSQPYRQILAAVDPLEDGGAERLVLDLATSLAELESSQLTLLHAWQLEGEAVLRSARSPLPQWEVDRMVERAYQHHKAKLGELLEGYGLSVDHPQVELVKGSAAAVIRERSEALGADLIVMGTLGRTGIPGFFIGNTAEEVLQTTRASILAVKPEGFVSPVTL
jgi:nucleotide-binding universal stress UspA family protein